MKSTQKAALKTDGIVEMAAQLAKSAKITCESIEFTAYSSTDENLTTAKILALGMLSKSNEHSVIKHIPTLTRNATEHNLHLIFKLLARIVNENNCTNDVIELCRQFAALVEMQSDIRNILEKLRICIPEHHLYSIKYLQESRDVEMLKRLFGTLNNNNFKKTKKILRVLPYEEYLEYFPSLTEQGISNYKELTNGRIFKDGLITGTFSHLSEIVRIEFLKLIDDVEQIEMFLKYNQIIENRNHQIEILKHIVKTAGITENIKSMCIQMCKSTNVSRRSFGALILREMCISDSCEQDIMEMIANLMMDSCKDIRDTVSVLSEKINVPKEFIIEKLETGKSYIIEGVCRMVDTTIIGEFEAEMKRLVKDKMKCTAKDKLKFIGILHCLILHRKVSEDTIKFIHEWAVESENWKAVKECCYFYHLNRRHESLMQILLHSDHLGVISRIKGYLEHSKLPLEPYLAEGLKVLREKKINSRKSGGLSTYFVLLSHNGESYEKIKKELLVLMEENTPHTTVHCLNIFKGILDTISRDEPFFLSLSLSVLSHSSYNFKNCGLSIFSTLCRKILAKSTFSAFLSLHKDISLRNYLRSALDTNDHLSIYLLLFIYEKLDLILECDKVLISECLKYNDFIQLKARNILCGGRKTCPEIPKEVLSMDDRTELSLLCYFLGIMNGSSSVKKDLVKEECKRKYGWGVYSDEYTRYCIVNQAGESKVLIEMQRFVENMIRLGQTEEYESNFYECSDWEYDLRNIVDQINVLRM